MTVDSFDTSRADHIYRVGPETLLAQSFAVASGAVSRYSKQTLEMSQPGPDGFALRWTVSGRVEQPTLIKGKLPGGDVVPFVRPEQSAMLPPAQPVAAWERDLGELGPHDEALLFFHGDPAKPTLRVLPGREPGLLATLRRAVLIQALPDRAQRQAAWFEYLKSAPGDIGRQAALRSLVADDAADWPRLQAALSALLVQPGQTNQLHSYATGIVAWGLMQGRWAGQQAEVADFVCRQFEQARDPWLALQLVLTLKQVMAYGAAEPADPVRSQIRQRVAHSVRQAAARSPAADVEYQLQQLREAYPGEF